MASTLNWVSGKNRGNTSGWVIIVTFMLTPALKISIVLLGKALRSVGRAPCVRDTPLMVPELTVPVRGTASGVSKPCVKEIYSVPEMPAESVMFVMLTPTRRDKFGMIGEISKSTCAVLVSRVKRSKCALRRVKFRLTRPVGMSCLLSTVCSNGAPETKDKRPKTIDDTCPNRIFAT